ncbi:MAG: enoyl-CoA hydratase/isomerase family protein [Burkholderiaceae bacterium]|nr:enoyl-CoA hydratase/isomerase family protein [Burkholderiaceae bacterium]
MKGDGELAGQVAAVGLPVVERRDDVLFITLNRPEQHNRLDPADIDALQTVLDGIRQELDAGPGAPRVLVLRGSGTRTFCSGFTLDAIGDQLDDRFERMLDSLESLPIPTIAAIQGGVYGGGTDLALCCDIRLGVTHTRMFMPAARFGIHYYPGGLRRYVSNLGLAASKKIFLTGLDVAAPEMLRIGFLTEVLEEASLDARVDEYVSAIARTEAGVVASMKEHLRRFAEACPDLEAAAHAARSSVKSDESQRRIAQLRGVSQRG